MTLAVAGTRVYDAAVRNVSSARRPVARPLATPMAIAVVPSGT